MWADTTSTLQNDQHTGTTGRVLPLVLTSLSFLWYVSQVAKFGFTFSIVDLLGLFFAINGLALIVLFRTKDSDIARNRFLFFVCCLNLVASVLFLGQFLSTFDPFYKVSSRLYQYLIRGLFLMASVSMLIALGIRRFFRFPAWLLLAACLITACWIFVYASPSIVREYYATGSIDMSHITGKPGDKALIFARPNPERGIQRFTLFLSAASWLLLFTVGRFRFHNSIKKHNVA